ncbi:H(+)/Cl(-) exchange transporter 7-like isoform X1 [Arapaima gigas]
MANISNEVSWSSLREDRAPGEGAAPLNGTRKYSRQFSGGTLFGTGSLSTIDLDEEVRTEEEISQEIPHSEKLLSLKYEV